MKKLTFHLTNKMKIFFGVVALLACVVGGSYAWFTDSKETTKNFTIGTLKVTNTIQTPADSTDYEPGEEVEMKGAVSNAGRIPSITRIDNVTQVKAIYADDNKTPIAAADRRFVEAPKSVLNYKFGPVSGDYFDNEGAYWFGDSQGQVYLLMDPQTNVDVKINASFSNTMGNQYQGANFKLGEKADSTQVLEGSVKDTFGISLNDLVPLENSTDTMGVQRSSHSANAQKALHHLKELAEK
ncbi:TasA family protein [Ligilactobacillus acidipiscis]|uniref:TasA family protein n=1 Tax=Ligilactobacillus acidipiscis TaxID=89059 RepID=UPI0023F92724|nr:TasA family protein [Ligilactobacillus acidipiscis]WEV57016.1 TasA family protein [Ligilactobacillus acidipiscis]